MNRTQFNIAYNLGLVHHHAWAMAIQQALDTLICKDQGKDQSWRGAPEPLRSALEVFAEFFESSVTHVTPSTVGAIEVIARELTFPEPNEWVLFPPEENGRVTQRLGSKHLSWEIDVGGGVTFRVFRTNPDLAYQKRVEQLFEKVPGFPKSLEWAALRDAQSKDLLVFQVDVDKARISIRSGDVLPENRDLQVLWKSLRVLVGADRVDQALYPHAESYIATERGRRCPMASPWVTPEERRWLGSSGIRSMMRGRAEKIGPWVIEYDVGDQWEIVAGPYSSSEEATQDAKKLGNENPTGLLLEPGEWRVHEL